MIYVAVKAVESEGRGAATGNGWHDTDDVLTAIGAELESFQRTWDGLGHGGIVTYEITVAPEASPRRTRLQGWPLPVEAS